MQQQIPDELKKVSTTLDVVEAQMVEGRTSDKTRRKNGEKISTVSKHSKCKKFSDNSTTPSESSESSE